MYNRHLVFGESDFWIQHLSGWRPKASSFDDQFGFVRHLIDPQIYADFRRLKRKESLGKICEISKQKSAPVQATAVVYKCAPRMLHFVSAQNFDFRRAENKSAHSVLPKRACARRFLVVTIISNRAHKGLMKSASRLGVTMVIDVTFSQLDAGAQFPQAVLETVRRGDATHRANVSFAQPHQGKLVARENVLEIKRFVRAFDNFRRCDCKTDSLDSAIVRFARALGDKNVTGRAGCAAVRACAARSRNSFRTGLVDL